MNAVHSNVRKRPVCKIFVKGEDNCKDDGTYKYVVRRKGKATSHYTSNLDEKIDFVQAFEF